MKQILSILSACLFLNTISAQEFTSYGMATNAELQMKQCSFDKDAKAVILLHEAFSDYDEKYHLVTNHHVRIKILKEDGIPVANISIPLS